MKKQTAFRIEDQLLERVKERAKREKRSLNNYVQMILLKEMEQDVPVSKNKPNEKTQKALEEVHNNIGLSSIENLDALYEELLKESDV